MFSSDSPFIAEQIIIQLEFVLLAEVRTQVLIPAWCAAVAREKLRSMPILRWAEMLSAAVRVVPRKEKKVSGGEICVGFDG